jgi:superfamily I DNA and RNA helicase
MPMVRIIPEDRREMSALGVLQRLFVNPVYSVGDVMMDSIYRFKGQAAPCIIFTEIDFATLDDLALRKLFVGVTRATIKLTMIVSERAAKKLIERLDDPEAKDC